MKSKEQLDITIQTLENIIYQLMSERSLSKVRAGLREFEKVFNGYCDRKLQEGYGLPCWGEDGCNCDFHKLLKGKGLFEKLEALENRADYDTRLGPP
jgi:hypothetical protein